MPNIELTDEWAGRLATTSPEFLQGERLHARRVQRLIELAEDGHWVRHDWQRQTVVPLQDGSTSTIFRCRGCAASKTVSQPKGETDETVSKSE